MPEEVAAHLKVDGRRGAAARVGWETDYEAYKAEAPEAASPLKLFGVVPFRQIGKKGFQRLKRMRRAWQHVSSGEY